MPVQIYIPINGFVLSYPCHNRCPSDLKKKNNESLSIYFSEITERERGEEDFHRWNQPCGKKRLDRPRKKS